MTDEVLVRCVRVEEIGEPAPGSQVRPCASCAASIWVDVAFLAELARRHPGVVPALKCEHCVVTEYSDHVAATPMLMPSQYQALRSMGYDDREIVEAFALSMVAGTQDMDATAEQIQNAPPGSALADAYAAACQECAMFVAVCKAQE